MQEHGDPAPQVLAVAQDLGHHLNAGEGARQQFRGLARLDVRQELALVLRRAEQLFEPIYPGPERGAPVEALDPWSIASPTLARTKGS